MNIPFILLECSLICHPQLEFYMLQFYWERRFDRLIKYLVLTGLFCLLLFFFFDVSSDAISPISTEVLFYICSLENKVVFVLLTSNYIL